MNEFYEALATVNVPQNLIGNINALNGLHLPSQTVTPPGVKEVATIKRRKLIDSGKTLNSSQTVTPPGVREIATAKRRKWIKLRV